MKKIIVLLVLMVMGYSIQAQGGIMTIGTATYDDGLGGGAEDYNLIWDDDNNGSSVVWLDYTNGPTDWQSQKDWALGLDNAITSYNIDPGYTITWADADWRLPTTVDGPYVSGYDGTTTGGYNITNSELGHLYYDELGNQGYYDTSGVYVGDGKWGLSNTGDFQNLVSDAYWSGTTESSSGTKAWRFGFYNGLQGRTRKHFDRYGLAVRSGDVSAVPVPAAVWLFGSGLVGLIGVSRRKRRHLALR